MKVGDGAIPEVFTTIFEITDINGPNLSVDKIDTTNHSSPGGFRQKVAGLIDAGDISFSVNFVPTATTHNASTGLLYWLKNKTVKNWQLVFPDTTAWTLPAFLTKFQPKEPVDGKLSADVALTISGQPTLS